MATLSKIDVTPLSPFDPISDPTLISQHWKIGKHHFETFGSVEHYRCDIEMTFVTVSSRQNNVEHL